MPNNKIFLLFLLLAFSIGLFSAVEALKCYLQNARKDDDPNRRDNIKVGNCWNFTGCSVALDCDHMGDMRGCTSHEDICQTKVSKSQTLNEICKYCEYCSGDFCNDKGLEKTGLKCIGKDAEFGDAFVEECIAGEVGCVAAWDCKNTKETVYGCSNHKDFCKKPLPNFDGQRAVSEVCNCQICTSDLCNEGGIKVKPSLEGKSTTKTVRKHVTTEKPIQKNEVKPKPNGQENPKSNGQDKSNGMEMEQSTSKTDVVKPEEKEEEGTAAAPPNGAVGIVGWGQFVIIPIGMMTLVLGAGLLKMPMI